MIDLHAILDMTWKLLLAMVVGGLVGYEREVHGRPAGLRTHILVCLGAALFTITSIQLAGVRFDPSRVAAQIVSGIGFLGAGTIIRQGSVIRGLTTAASLWTVAAIGMTVGIGGDMAYLGIIASLIVFATLSTINRLEHRLIAHSRFRELVVTIGDDRKNLAPVLASLAEHGVAVQGLEEDFREADTIVFRLRLQLPADLDSNVINQRLSEMSAVRGYHWV